MLTVIVFIIFVVIIAAVDVSVYFTDESTEKLLYESDTFESENKNEVNSDVTSDEIDGSKESSMSSKGQASSKNENNEDDFATDDVDPAELAKNLIDDVYNDL